MHNVVIVGGGPAGLSAALAAAAAGAPVLLIDSNPRLGGQYWRMPSDDVGQQGIDSIFVGCTPDLSTT